MTARDNRAWSRLVRQRGGTSSTLDERSNEICHEAGEEKDSSCTGLRGNPHFAEETRRGGAPLPGLCLCVVIITFPSQPQTWDT